MCIRDRDYVGETSGLLFDPAPATYFLMDVMVSRTLPWVEAVGVLRGSGAGLLARGDASSVEIASALGVLRDIEGLTHGIEPVSYTHLDVYKRQRQHHWFPVQR